MLVLGFQIIFLILAGRTLVEVKKLEFTAARKAKDRNVTTTGVSEIPSALNSSSNKKKKKSKKDD